MFWEPDMDPIDAWSTAEAMIRTYGSDARALAARWADDLLDQGDAVGSSNWKQVARSIDNLQQLDDIRRLRESTTTD